MPLPLDPRGRIISTIDDFRNKRVIVTGPTQGIGKETCAALCGFGAAVVLAARDIHAAERVAKEIKDIYPNASITVGPQLDLSSQSSIREFAKWYKSTGEPLHLLVNNAGANNMDAPSFTSDGIGMLCQVNYLGPYTLTRLLEEQLVESAPSRVVNLSSVTHRFAKIGNPATFLTNWRQGSQYQNTKLANALFAFELHRRLASAGVTSCAVDPGGVASSIWRDSVFSKQPFKFLIDTLYAPPNDGAAAVIHACIAPWHEDAAIAMAVNAKCNPHCTPRDTSPPDRKIGDTKECHSPNNVECDMRYYARGLFAWPGVTLVGQQPTHVPGTSHTDSLATTVSSKSTRTFSHKADILFRKMQLSLSGMSVLLHSAVDWPLRRISGQHVAAKTVPVAASPSAYDMDLSKALWEVSADAVGLPRETLVGTIRKKGV